MKRLVIMLTTLLLLICVLPSCSSTKTGSKESVPGLFENNLLPVQLDDKWGYIDKSGELVIPYQWEKAGTFRNGIAYVYDDGQYGYIDRNGTFKVPMGLKDSDLTPIKAPDSGLWGYADRDGKVVIPFEWEYAREFSEGLACVEKNGVCGFIDYSGALVIPRRFLWAGDFKDGYAPIHDCVRAEASHVSKDGTLV